MKKIAYLGIVLILLAVIAVPAMAKSPNNNGNGNGGSHGNGNGASAGESSTGVIPADQGQGNQTNHQNQHDQGNRGNSGVRGNGNQGQTHPNTPFYLQGTVDKIDTGTGTITVTLTHGNAMVKQFIGTYLKIKVTGATQIYEITREVDDEAGGGESTAPILTSSESATSNEGDSNRVIIPFDQRIVNQKVAIHGNLVNGVYTARLITVYIQAPVGETAGEQP
jgi:hypothetical protein